MTWLVVSLTPLNWKTSSSFTPRITTKMRSPGSAAVWGNLLDTRSLEWRTQKPGTIILQNWAPWKLRRKDTANTTLMSGTITCCLNPVSHSFTFSGFNKLNVSVSLQTKTSKGASGFYGNSFAYYGLSALRKFYWTTLFIFFCSKWKIQRNYRCLMIWLKTF